MPRTWTPPRPRAWQVPCPRCARSRNPADTTQRGMVATPLAALLRSWGRPSPLHENGCKGSALSPGPYRKGRAAAPLRLSSGLCGPEASVAYCMHRIVSARLDCRYEIRRAVPDSVRHRSQVSTVPSDSHLSGVAYFAPTWADGPGGPTAGGKRLAGVGGIAPEGFAAWPVAGLAQNPKNLS